MEKQSIVWGKTKFKKNDILHTPDGDFKNLYSAEWYKPQCNVALYNTLTSERYVADVPARCALTLDDGKYHIIAFLARTQEECEQLRNTHLNQSRVFFYDECTFTRPATPKSYTQKGLTKPMIMAYVVAVNGPMTRLELMKQVAFIEGKPFIPTSNVSYFSKTGMYTAPGVVEQKILQPMGKNGNAIVYTFGTVGLELANKVIEKIGKEPALLAAKQ